MVQFQKINTVQDFFSIPIDLKARITSLLGNKLWKINTVRTYSDMTASLSSAKSNPLQKLKSATYWMIFQRKRISPFIVRRGVSSSSNRDTFVLNFNFIWSRSFSSSLSMSSTVFFGRFFFFALTPFVFFKSDVFAIWKLFLTFNRLGVRRRTSWVQV